MKILIIGASFREHSWWLKLKRFVNDHEIKYLNCSSRKMNYCENLKDYAKPLISYSPSVSDKYLIPTSYLIHEHNVYPSYSIRELSKKFEIHLRAYEKFYEKNKFDIVYVENGGFIFINAMLVFCQEIKIPMMMIEMADIEKKCFMFKNSKQPSLANAVKTPEYKQSVLLDSKKDLLIQKKDLDIDNRFDINPTNQIQKFISYLKRRHDSKYISTDGSMRYMILLKLERPFKTFLIKFHILKEKVFNKRFILRKRIIVPLHLERDLHLTERTNYHSQLKFLDRIIKENKDKKVYFKLHPHSLVLGLSLVNHIKLFFKNCFITFQTPSELDKVNDSVHTLGSKYGLQSARNNIDTYIYGYTFFSDLINKNKLTNLNKLKIDKNLEDVINKYRLDVDLYENNVNSIKTSANTLIQISSAECNKSI